MNSNQARVVVITQHLVDARQERDNWLQVSDFGDMEEFLYAYSEPFAEEETPEYRYMKWEDIPDSLVNMEQLCPNSFEIWEAMEQLEGPDKDCFFDWCDRYGHDISTEDAHLLVAHYIEPFGNTAYTGGEPCPDSEDDGLPYYPDISSNYFDTSVPHFEVFDDSYDQNTCRIEINFKGPVMPVDPYSQMALVEILNILLMTGHTVDVNGLLMNRSANPQFGPLSGYSKWSFSGNHFTLWRRMEYNSPVYFNRRIFNIRFGILAGRNRERNKNSLTLNRTGYGHHNDKQ